MLEGQQLWQEGALSPPPPKDTEQIMPTLSTYEGSAPSDLGTTLRGSAYPLHGVLLKKTIRGTRPDNEASW